MSSTSTLASPSNPPSLATGPQRGKSGWILNAAQVSLITLVAAFLRFHALTAKSFWLDEGFSVGDARLPWRDFIAALWRTELNMSSYFVLLHLWLLGGKSEAYIRGLSLLMSVATVPVLYLLGTRLFGRTTGLLAAWLLALNAFHVRYAQEARGYAMVALFATLATWLLVRNLQEPASAYWSLYAVACALTVYSHFYGALVIFTHFVSLFFLRREKLPWRRIAWSYGTFGVLILPIAIYTTKTGSSQITWLPPLDAKALSSFGEGFSGNYGRTLFILYLLMSGAAALYAARIWRARPFEFASWRYLFVFLWLFVPLGIVIGASLKQPYFYPRYMIPCLPALVLLVAVGITRLRPAVIGWGVGIAITVCALMGTIAYYHMDFDVGHENWRAASQYVLEHAQPGDTILIYPSPAQAAFEYYRWLRQQDSTWPKPLNPTFNALSAGLNLINVPGTQDPVVGVPGNRVWLVLLWIYSPTGKPDPTATAVRDWLAAGRRRVDVQRIYPIDVILFAKDAPSADPTPPHTP